MTYRAPRTFRKSHTICVAILLLLLTAGFAGSQIQEGHFYGQEGYPDEEKNDENGDNSDYYNHHSRANYIKSKLPGHLGLDGSGIEVGLPDQPYEGETHVDLKGRHRTELFTGGGGQQSGDSHGNSVSGLMGGNGNRNPRFEGIATGSMVHSLVADRTVLIRDIYSTSSGFGEIGTYGRYDAKSVTTDILLLQHPDKLMLFSAGNTGGIAEGYPWGYLKINAGPTAAKNVLTVGRQTLQSHAPSYGPARDGRIKPEIIATTKVVAPAADHTYSSRDGSSFSTPLVAGISALLYQHFRNLNDGRDPDGALIKAILMNSADYVDSPGPTFALQCAV